MTYLLAVGLAAITGLAISFGFELIALAVALVPLALRLWRTSGHVLVGLGTFAMTFTGLAVGPVTLADVFLVAGGIHLLLLARVMPPFWVVVAPAVVLFSALLGHIVGTTSSFGGAVRMAIAMAYVPTVISWAGTTITRRRSLASWFVLGAAANATVALLVRLGGVVGLSLASIAPSFNRYRFTGLSAHPNQLGIACALAIPLVMALYGRNRCWALAGALCVIGVGASGSRTGLLAAGVGVIVYLRVTRRLGARSLTRLIVAAAACLALLAAVGADVSIDRLLGEAPQVSEANQERAAVASDAWGDFLTSPLIGVGYEGAHNLYLTLAQGGGILALAAFTLYAKGCRSAWRQVPLTPVDAAGVSFVVLWLVASVTHNGYYDRFLFFGVGMVVAAALEQRRRRASLRRLPVSLP